MIKKSIATILVVLMLGNLTNAQQNIPRPATPPMSWMTWNFFADNITESDIRDIADAMVSTGMLEAGYDHIIIDDGWQGGRDNKNNIIPDPKKFPSGIKALADYVHARGLKLGIYSDAAQLTCAGYTASLGFEDQDAKTFASWGIDYLKYDYCNAPADVEVAKERYKMMGDALKNSGRDITFGICEWGHLQPWLWGAEAGGHLWRTTDDVRDKWKRKDTDGGGEGILDILNKNLNLGKYAGKGKWNDMDMLVVGLYGKKGPSGDLGGVGCTDIEYQSQMSLWSIMSSPLTASNDIRNMNEETKRILMNKEVIAINQDALGNSALVTYQDEDILVLKKKLSGGDIALAILNKSDEKKMVDFDFTKLGLSGKYMIRDLWIFKDLSPSTKWKGDILAHETKLFKIKLAK